jgi:hypothetical protein
MSKPKPPVEKNINEARVELLLKRIRNTIEQMPIPISASDDARLAAADAKLWEVLSVLTD